MDAYKPERSGCYFLQECNGVGGIPDGEMILRCMIPVFGFGDLYYDGAFFWHLSMVRGCSHCVPVLGRFAA